MSRIELNGTPSVAAAAVAVGAACVLLLTALAAITGKTMKNLSGREQAERISWKAFVDQFRAREQ